MERKSLGQPSAVGCWLLALGSWLLALGSWLLAFGFRLPNWNSQPDLCLPGWIGGIIKSLGAFSESGGWACEHVKIDIAVEGERRLEPRAISASSNRRGRFL